MVVKKKLKELRQHLEKQFTQFLDKILQVQERLSAMVALGWGDFTA